MAAHGFRERNNLGSHPLGDLIPIIERATGIDVAVLAAGPDEHGLAARSPETGTTFIVVATTGNPMRQRSSLGHELAHVEFEDWTPGRELERRDPVEVRADAFSRHLLLPQAAIHDVFGDRHTVAEADLSMLVQLFQVSPAIATIALHQAGLVDASRKSEWLKMSTPQLAARHGWGDQYKAWQAESRQTRAPRRLLARAIEGYAEGVVSVQAIARLRGMPANDVEDELAESNIMPRAQETVRDDPQSLPQAPVVDLAFLDDLDDSNGTA
ncbi:ImmA/IrrE family metallo-endopeptidase [Kocuria tytonis]|uniref:ImmA/IrrE family metallo-endopeptidase n=1 Tax=Kocuria tytonis TaxID=2054280 RepID=A0A495A6P2_9MICC|nr:ImmA/IrrE family metallo-endopeptidase [Kocuria tytonis]RKQ35012.1 ImmA/IrrE family metallo-endopeptidase [Kocuria tytonis]